MGKIVFMATSNYLMDTMNRFVSTLPSSENIHIISAGLNNAVYVARGLLPQEVDAVVVRGNTATVLSEANLPFPVIPILVGIPEIAEAFQQAKELSQKEKPLIGVSGFEQSINNIKALLALSGVEIRFYHIGSMTDIEKCVSAAIQDRVDVMISGQLCAGLSREKGLPAVEMKASIASIQQAYNQAVDFQKSAMKQRALSEDELVLAQYAPEALLAVDSAGVLLSGNNRAGELLGMPAPFLKGKLLERVDALKALSISELQTLIARNEIRLMQINGREMYMSAEKAEFSQSRQGFVLTISSAADMQRRGQLVRKALRQRRERPTLHIEDLRQSGVFPSSVLDEAQLYAGSSRPLLISEEPGGGADLLAAAIHASGTRKSGEFIARDCRTWQSCSCADVERGLHALLRRAHHGTLFLKNLHTLPAAQQESLLQFIMTGVVPEPEAQTAFMADTHIIVSGKEADLLPELRYLLSAYRLRVPPLCTHPENIGAICAFIIRYADVKTDLDEVFLRELEKYRWPGNLIQLYGFLCRIQDEERLHRLSLNRFRELLRQCGAEEQPETLPRDGGRYTVVHNRVLTADKLHAVLEKHHGSKTLAAQELGISRTTLWKRLRELEASP